MLIHGYEISGEWKNSQCGQIVEATKGGKKYIIKKYQTPVAPINNGTLDAKTFAHNKKMFEEFVDLRTKINSEVRKLTGPGGNIIIPNEEFIEGNQYYEASEFVEGAIAEEILEDTLKALPLDVKKLLMQTAAGALLSIHSKHIIHGDLKLKNVLLVKKKNGNYVAKLIDFDSSYLDSKKPDEIIGTIDYYSPELGLYADSEDDREELADKITTKTDIFSLGLIFHFYLCGSLPKPTDLTEKLEKRIERGKIVYCWVALNSGCSLEISDRIKDVKYIELLSDMLSVDPNDRPSASEVLTRLKKDKEDTYEIWEDEGEKLDIDSLKSKGIVCVRKCIVSGKKHYKILHKSGKKEICSIDQMRKNGFLLVDIPSGFCKPWPSHPITFKIEILEKRGFVSGEQMELSGVKGYKLYRDNGTSVFMNVDKMIGMNYAYYSSEKGKHPKEPDVEKSPGYCDPWEEHHIIFDIDKIRLKGYVSVERAVMQGEKGYYFKKSDGTVHFIKRELALVQKLATKSDK